MNYYIMINGRPVGPMTCAQMMAYNVNPNTMVSTDGMNWNPLYSYPELMQFLNSNKMNGVSQYNDPEVNNKKIMCGVFAILLGVLGVQYFIMGKVGGGFLTILLSCVTCGIWSIVTLIQGIVMLTMSDSEFKRKYLDSTSVLPLF